MRLLKWGFVRIALLYMQDASSVWMSRIYGIMLLNAQEIMHISRPWLTSTRMKAARGRNFFQRQLVGKHFQVENNNLSLFISKGFSIKWLRKTKWDWGHLRLINHSKQFYIIAFLLRLRGKLDYRIFINF